MGFHFKAAIGGKEARKMPSQRMLELARRAKFAKVAEFFFRFRIERSETDFVVSEARDLASGKNVYGKINGDGAGMEEIERPKIERAASQVHPAGRMRDDRTGRWQFYSVKNRAIWRNLL